MVDDLKVSQFEGEPARRIRMQNRKIRALQREMREVSDYVREAVFLVEEALPKGVDEVQKALTEFRPKF